MDPWCQGQAAGQRPVLGSNVASLTTWNSIVLGKKTSRTINKKRSVKSHVSLPLHQARIRQRKVLVTISTSENLCQYDYIKKDQLVFEGPKLLIEADTWAFHKWYVYKKWIGSETAMNVFFSKKYTNCNTKGNIPLPQYQIITIPFACMFMFKQHQSSHGRKSV